VQNLNDDVTASRHNAITRAVERVSPAVVGINVTEVREMRMRDPFGDFFNDPFFERYFGSRPRTYKREVRGLGSGYIISPDGYVVTNDHVAGRASKVIVTMTDGKEYDAEIIGSDPTTDVALLKIDGKNLPYVELGHADDIIIGEWVIAFGNPFGLFDINSKPTVTVGVVSNTNVDLSPQENRVYRGMIQTDAAISSGNSGGPLVNALGQVVGMNTIIYSTSQNYMGSGSIGIGFAVPVDRVREIITELKSGKKINRNFWTGMSIREIDDRMARYLNLSDRDGVVVIEIAPNSPASRAGIEVGDVITGMKGERVPNEDKALMLVNESRVGDIIDIEIQRSGKPLKLTMTLTERGT
jgi:serine protease Do